MLLDDIDVFASLKLFVFGRRMIELLGIRRSGKLIVIDDNGSFAVLIRLWRASRWKRNSL